MAKGRVPPLMDKVDGATVLFELSLHPPAMTARETMVEVIKFIRFMINPP